MSVSSVLTKSTLQRVLFWVVTSLIAGILFYLSVRGIDLRQVWAMIRAANSALLASAMGLISLALFLRALRWRVLLSAAQRLPLALVFSTTAIGYLANSTMPARAGEVIRSVMISARTGLSKSFVLTTALSERMVDALALVSVSAIVLLTLPSNPGWLRDAAKPFALLGLAGVATVVALPVMEARVLALLRRTPLPLSLRGRAERMAKGAMQGGRSLHDGRRLASFLLLTCAIWCIDGTIAVIAAGAIGVSMSFPVALLLVTGLGLGSALPSTPGYVGVYQFVALSVLTPFGISKTESLAYILLFQALSLVGYLFWGLFGLYEQRRSRLIP